jgi:hypothetical protein
MARCRSPRRSSGGSSLAALLTMECLLVNLAFNLDLIGLTLRNERASKQM